MQSLWRDFQLASITIRNIDDDVKKGLRQRAATRGVSMEEEARLALRNWVKPGPPAMGGLGTRLSKRFEPLGGVDLELPPRGPARPLPDFSE
jgi:plasmid stability protein